MDSSEESYHNARDVLIKALRDNVKEISRSQWNELVIKLAKTARDLGAMEATTDARLRAGVRQLFDVLEFLGNQPALTGTAIEPLEKLLFSLTDLCNGGSPELLLPLRKKRAPRKAKF